MWGSLSKAGIALLVLAPAMWLLRTILDPLIQVATSGPNASHSSVQTIGNWFDVLSEPTLTLIAGIAIAVYLLGRSVVERRPS